LIRIELLENPVVENQFARMLNWRRLICFSSTVLVSSVGKLDKNVPVWQSPASMPDFAPCLQRTILNVLLPIVALTLFSCTKPKESAKPLSAHQITSDGTPVPGASEPEVVQLKKIDETNGEKQVTVENNAGDYVLLCEEEANKESEHPIPSCLTPRPQVDYLLFKSDTKWLITGAKDPMTLKFMQDFTVAYNNAENIGLLSAHTSNEGFGVYKLLSWNAKKSD
jgi:hypothetical protein